MLCRENVVGGMSERRIEKRQIGARHRATPAVTRRRTIYINDIDIYIYFPQLDGLIFLAFLIFLFLSFPPFLRICLIHFISFRSQDVSYNCTFRLGLKNTLASYFHKDNLSSFRNSLTLNTKYSILSRFFFVFNYIFSITRTFTSRFYP